MEDSQEPTSLPSLIGHLPDVRERTQLSSPDFCGPRYRIPKGSNTKQNILPELISTNPQLLSSTYLRQYLSVHHYGNANTHPTILSTPATSALVSVTCFATMPSQSTPKCSILWPGSLHCPNRPTVHQRMGLKLRSTNKNDGNS